MEEKKRNGVTNQNLTIP